MKVAEPVNCTAQTFVAEPATREVSVRGRGITRAVFAVGSSNDFTRGPFWKFLLEIAAVRRQVFVHDRASKKHRRSL